MKKKLYFLTVLMCILCGLSPLKAQETVTIGEGGYQNENDKLPLYTNYEYSVSQQIYTADDLEQLSAGDVIKSIAFNVANVTTKQRKFSIYLKNITKDEFSSSTDYESIDDSNLVYSTTGTLFGTSGWITFDFSTPFTYNGDNLLLCVHDYTGDWDSFIATFSLNQTEKNRAIYRYYEDTIGDPVNGINSNGWSGMITGHNQIQLTFEASSVPQPLSLTASAAKETIYDNETVQLTAKAKGGSGTYTYSWSPATGLDNASSASPIFTPSATGTYTFTCTVSDGTETLTADVTITVEEAPVETVIGQTGGDYSVLPGYNYYNYSISQQIYTSDDLSDLGKGFKINSISFMPAVVNQSARNWSVYLINTTKEQFDSTTGFIALSESDCLYTGDVNFVKNEWTTINFTMPFTYEGNNILVCVKDNKGSYNYESNNQYYSIASNGKLLSILNYNDNYSYNVSNVANYQKYETSGVRSAIKLEYEKVALPLSLTASAEQETIYTDETVQFTATASGGTEEYTYSWSPATGLNNASSASPIFTPSATGTYTFTCTVNDGETTETASVTVNVIEKPAAPTTAPVVAAEVKGSSSITLSWNAVDGAEWYNIYASGTGSSNVTNLNATEYTFTGLQAETKYCFIVNAVNAGGESPDSEEVCETTDKIKQYRIRVSTTSHVHYGKYLNINSNTLPGNSGNNTNVNVSIYAESNNQIFTLEDAGNGKNYYLRGADGYYIKCGTNSLGKAWNVYAYSTTEKTPIFFNYIEGSNNFYLRDSDKTGDNYFKVENGNIYCNAPSTNTDVVTWTLEEIIDLEPAVPANLRIIAFTHNTISLAWDEAENATGYNIYKDDNSYVTGVTGTPFQVSGLDPESDYCFTVTATRGNKESNHSNEICKTTLPLPAPTEAPEVNAIASTSEAAITLTWNDVIDATYYNVYREGVLIAENVEETTYTDNDNLNLSTDYCYTVKAANNQGLSDVSSAEVCATTYDGIPIIVIGEGTYTGGSTRVPTNTYNKYSVSQQIYTKAEIGLSACEINKIAFYQDPSTYTFTRNLEIYMVNTDKEVFTSTTDWVNMSESNKVFDGSYTFVPGWCEIELAKDFSYKGENILLCVIDNTGTATSPISFKQNNTPSSYQTLYYFTDNYGPFNASSLSSSGTRKYQNTHIKLFYKILPDGVTPTPEEITFENSIRGGNYWTEKDLYSSTKNISLKAKNATISSISLSDNSFFTIPANIDLTANPVEFNIGHKANSTAGNKTANLIVTHTEGTTEIPLSATVYAPATPDVFELAQEITINAGSNSYSPVFANLHDDYILPSEVNEGNTPDAVYSFELTEDCMLNINITGTNAITALYKEDFNGENGPSADNDYKLSSTKFFFDFEDGNFSGLTLKDADGDGRNWEIKNSGYNSNYCAISYSNDGYLLTPENYIITDKKYYITESSVLSFYATSSYSSYKDSYKIEYSENGVDFQVLTSAEASSVNNFELHEIDLSSLAGKDVYLAINHYSDMKDNIRIDDLRLSDGTDDVQSEGDIYPAGKYYLVAAAEDAFTVNITKTALPAPNAITYTSPANEAMEQVNPELCFELGKYTTEYQVLLGTTNPPTTVVKDWTSVTKSDYINSYQTEGLNNNAKYYWQVNARNSSGTTEGEVYSFVTPLNRPTNVVASKTELFSGEETTITWDVTASATSYNVYVNGSRFNGEAITTTSYTLSNLGYNINPGYEITVTAVYDGLGESIHSDIVLVKVSSECDLIINVQNANGAILAGAEISLYGIDQFGNTCQYGPFTSDENGNVSQRVHLLKDGESYYVNATLAPYSTITNQKLISSSYMYDNGVINITVTMNLPAPANFYAENDKIYEGNDVVLHWDEVNGATSYNIYVDGVKHNTEALTGTTYTISGLAYNPNGYNVTATTILPEGESIHSNAVLVKVGGTFTLTINVTDNNENPLEGALVTMTLDEYGSSTDAIDNNLQAYYELTTNEEGKINIAMPLFKEEYTAYNIEVSKAYYESNNAFVFYYGNDYPDAAFRTNGGAYEISCTLSLVAPENFRANKEYYIEGGTASLTWDAIDADNLLGYNIYYGEFNEETYETDYIKLNDELLTRTRFVVSNLEYGYQTYYLTAVYDLGESPKTSTSINVINSGSVRGTVTDANSNPISGATVTISGKDQFEDDQTYNLITNANGEYFSNAIMPSHWDQTYQYVVTVSKADYISNSYSPVYVEANVETAVPTIVLQAKPETIFNVTATISQNSEGDDIVDITWDNVANTEKYNVFIKDLSNDNVTQLNEYNITWTSYTHDNWMTLANGDYQYGVSAFVKNITTESFEGGVIPTGWSLEADFVAKDWTIYDNTASYIAPRTGNYAIYRNGDHNDSGLANHITMAPIDMTSADNATLSFYYVNVNSPSGGDWVNTLKVSAREYGSDSWNELFTTNAEVSSWTKVEIPLKEYAGKMVEVRFSASSNYAQYVAIDDITVTLPSEESKINWSNTLTKQGIEFTGIGDWNEPSNWNTGEVPSDDASVAISGSAVITDEDITVKALTIIDGGSLTVVSGSLSVTKDLVNNIANAFIIKDGAQVFQSNNNVKATFQMDIKAPTSWDEDHTKGWQFIASPMKEVKTSSFETDGVDFDLFKYDGTKELEWVNYKGHNEDVVEGVTYLYDFATDFDGWNVIDANGDGYSWGHVLTDEGHSFSMMGTPEGYDDAGCLFNDATWYDMNNDTIVNATPDDYLVAPFMMNIGKYSALRFKMKGYSSMTQTPEISVLVSEEYKNTDEYVPADFTTVGIAPVVNAVWEDVVISLEEYAGKDVRIAIRHNAPDSWNTALLIDKVELTNIAFETEFQQGRGYIASYETEATVEFEGILSNESSFTFSEIKDYNEDDHFSNFYLLGNPFAFNMKWNDNYITANGLADGYAVVTLDGGYEYATDGEIKVGDGFFVKATDENPSLSYTTPTENRSRNNSKEKSYINIIASGKNGKDNVIINFDGGDKAGFAKLENFNEDIAVVYVTDNGKRCGILSHDEDVEEINLYFDVKKMGEYTINAISKADFASVTLVDLHNGNETDLLTSSYTFHATSSDNPNRFVLRISRESTDKNFVYKSGDELIVNAKGTVQLIDVMGRIVYSSDIVNDNHRINISNFDNAAYIIRVVNTNEIKTQKIVI